MVTLEDTKRVTATAAQGDRVEVEVEGVGVLLDVIKEYADTHQAHELFFAGQGN